MKVLHDCPDEYYVCRGLVSLLLEKGLKYPRVQIGCCIDSTGQTPAYVVNGNGFAKAVLSEVLEEMFGRPFALGERPWRLDVEELICLRVSGELAKRSALAAA